MDAALRTLLLARTYEPIKVISWQRAVTLLFLGKIEILEEYEDELRSSVLVIKVPAVVRLLNTFRRVKKPVKFSRVNIYARDGYKCQYCGAKMKVSDLTYDHVVPRAQGGKTIWTNIVTCCDACNVRKGGRTPFQAGMRLLSRPVQPEWVPALVVRISTKSIPQAWTDYLYWTGNLGDGVNDP